ncbi:zinc-binding dehydrogenase [Enterococcus hulanensis]|uniref:zinc-dependent alcohol dehydrogenase n=1 Tax=Enterococcus hulanensis TaxID=2559929 RepID=UPI0028905863|nr:zinc-binding dehydrogenase [Enterococcus hulanensis]MDT2662638.1 zinc-binding dehydrogenase [Enterococcus hulanensis]
MKALRKVADGLGNMKLCDLDKPLPNDDEVLIKVMFSGICGSDIHAFKGEYNKQIPLTLGHEFIGIVHEKGDKVTDLTIGDRVVSETTYEVCEKCVHCLAQEYNLCSQRKGLGTQIDGSFATFVLAKAERCHKLPDTISNEVAALIEPLACCIHAAMEKTRIHPNEKIAVFGPGPIGVLMALVVKSLGADVTLIGISKDAYRLAKAKELGIAQVIDSQTIEWTALLEERTNQLGFDQVFECSGSPQALQQALEIVKKKGIVIQEGLFAKNPVPVDMSLLLNKEIQLIGSRTQKTSSWHKTIEWLQSSTIDLSPVITKILPLDQWEEAFRLAMNGEELKVLLKP